MESTPAGAWRSFIAAAICFPAFLALRLLSWSSMELPPEHLVRPLTAEMIGYVYGWVLFALVSLPVVAAWGKAGQWPRFVSAWNWISVVQYLAQIVLAVPLLVDLPPIINQALTLIVVGYSLWLEWFVARSALGVTGGRAAGLVVLDLALGLFVAGFVQRLSLG